MGADTLFEGYRLLKKWFTKTIRLKNNFRIIKMRKTICSVLAILVFINFCYTQDTITISTNEKISSKTLEITTTEVKYKKFDNLNGPTFSILKSDVIMIKYENGTTDFFNKNLVALNNEILKISRENPLALTEKGNKVFIEIPDEASRAGERYFVNALKEWGYWKVVENINEAHFIIVFNIDKKAMLDKTANVTFKTREEKQFKKSDTYRASTNAFNGYNAFKAVANKIVEKYLKKEFK